MTDMTTPPLRPIAAIESNLDEAVQQVLATAEAHKEAQRVRGDLAAELHRARLAADAALPRAKVFRGYGEAVFVVIARRTKTRLFTRSPGADPACEQAWKESKYAPGRWHPFPSEKWGRTYLEIPQEMANA